MVFVSASAAASAVPGSTRPTLTGIGDIVKTLSGP